MNYTEVNERSLALYTEGKWHDLLIYGKQAITQGQDFVALRLIKISVLTSQMPLQ
jgi:hypothetical protein